MGYKNYNANPTANRVEDCTVRAISAATGEPWETVYVRLCILGLIAHDMPHANHVWGGYLRQNGWRRHIIPDTCPDCYTVAQFTADHPRGRYILALPSHVVAVVEGEYTDTWDSGECLPVYYWEKE